MTNQEIKNLVEKWNIKLEKGGIKMKEKKHYDNQNFIDKGLKYEELSKRKGMDIKFVGVGHADNSDDVLIFQWYSGEYFIVKRNEIDQEIKDLEYDLIIWSKIKGEKL